MSASPPQPAPAAGNDAPAPGQAPLVAANAAALLRRNAKEFGDRSRSASATPSWTHAEYFEESCRFAALFLERLPADGPRHVAVLLDNTPDYLFAFGGAALIGAAVVGLNHTGATCILRDIEHAHCGLVITEPRHAHLLEPIADRLPPLFTSTRFTDDDDPVGTFGFSFDDALAAHADATDPGSNPTSTASGR